jgi:hypothetical protein
VSSLDVARRFVVATATLGVLALSSAAWATVARIDAIDPGVHVNGMVVVQGLARGADVALFGEYCDPVVTAPGRRTRMCSVPVPHVQRIFVGHGIWAVSRKLLESSWSTYARRTDMWIDGRRVRLDRYGYSDRWLSNFPPADGRDALLREWSIVLIGAEGRHSIRYRTGAYDTTWRFRVAPG